MLPGNWSRSRSRYRHQTAERLPVLGSIGFATEVRRRRWCAEQSVPSKFVEVPIPRSENREKKDTSARRHRFVGITSVLEECLTVKNTRINIQLLFCV